MELYPEGIKSLMNEKSPPINEVSYLIVFNCTDDFYNKYNGERSQEVDITSSSLTLMNNTNLYTDSIMIKSSRYKDLKKGMINKFFSSTTATEKQQRLIEKITTTLKYRDLLMQSFEDLDKYEEALIKDLLDKQAIINGNLIREKDPENYPSNDLIKEKLGDLPYYEINYEDFILLFFRVIKFLTHLKIKIELAKGENKLYTKIYGNEKIFDKIATYLRYEMQLKPYAYKYAKYLYEIKKTKLDAEADLINDTNLANSTLINEERDLFVDPAVKKYPHMQFHELDVDDALHWPPYAEFETHKGIKFRRYENNDDYHDCRKDPEFLDEEINKNAYMTEGKKDYDTVTTHEANCCSKFRNLDKLRLINNLIDQIIKFSYLHKKEIFVTITLKRNFISYGGQLSHSNLLWSTLNVFSDEGQSKFVNLTRNFYGEKFSFYFLWLLFYCKWLLFPAILGVITFIIAATAKNLLGNNGQVKTFKDLTFNYYDIALFAFCLLITFWSITFIKVWKQKEKLYCYFWGMENQEENEPNQENFVADEKIPFLFGQKLQTTSTWKKIGKTIISYFIILTLMLINTAIVYLLFRWKAYKTNNGTDNSIFWPIVMASINGCQIRVMSFIDEIIARKLSDWENHEKASQRENALALKLIMFEFINNYFSLYYIAFVKPYVYEYCLDNNCLKEIEIQLYTVLIISFSFNIIEILIPHLKNRYRRRKLINKMKEDNPNMDEKQIEIVPHSHEHQFISDEMETLIYEYNDMIILFGYVCFFSVAAPLTPLFIFLIIYVEKFIDSYKMFYLSKISIIEGAPGISIYNSVLKIFHFVGMLTNIAVVLFTSPSLLNVKAYHESELNDNNDFILKFLVLAVLENVILFIIRFVNFDYFPKWYEHLPLIKSMYTRKYYNRETQALPHKSSRKNILDKSQSEESFFNLDGNENSSAHDAKN